jgi:uncharacterized RDD family membrane protein YckC
MKCPKCGYLGFEHVERCRNCGYEFALNRPAAEAPDLALRPVGSPLLQPLADLPLTEGATRPAASALGHFAPGPALREAIPAPGPTPELPLFGSSTIDDRPLITRPSAPRTPLAVRRATPEVPRLRSEPRAASLDLLPAELDVVPRERTAPPERIVQPERVTLPQGTIERERHAGPRGSVEYAAVPQRVAAAAIDLALLAAIDVVVAYFTLQICGLAFAEFRELPWVPLAVFLVLQNVAYLVVFTAGGQTLGQMALGIKVVPMTDADASPGLQAALVRTGMYLALVVPAGLGLLSVLFARDGRGLHDRVAATGVVRRPA